MRCRPLTPWLVLAAVMASLPFRSAAQPEELLPEVDIHHKLDLDVRVYFQAKQTREGGQPVTAEFGPSVEVYLRRLGSLVKIVTFDKYYAPHRWCITNCIN